MRWQRMQPGWYWAEAGGRTYRVTREESGWTLTIWRTGTVDNLDLAPWHAETTGTDRKADACQVAEEYARLGDGYQAHEHGYRNRLTEAILRVYAPAL